MKIKNLIIVYCLILTATFAISGQPQCAVTVAPGNNLTIAIKDYYDIGCGDLRVRNVGLDMWEIGPFIPNFLQSRVIVSGAGDPLINGIYVLTGTFNNRPYYNLIGEGTSELRSSIYWFHVSRSWRITAHDGTPMYESQHEGIYPWLLPWSQGWGDGPPPFPTVTEQPITLPKPRISK